MVSELSVSSETKQRAAGIMNEGIRRRVGLIVLAPTNQKDIQKALVINEKTKSTWKPADKVQSAGWKRPSGFPDYSQYDDPRDRK